MTLDADSCYRIISARDGRFDGAFYVGVSTTGVYCRPVCTVRTPRRDRCHFFSNAASAEASGFRPCLRCRPELAPGSAPVDSVRRVARSAVAHIEAGALNERSVNALAADFGLSPRQLHRVIEAEYGVSPLALAQTRRLLTAKQLLTDTTLRVVDVAFASGFNSVRQFNRLFRRSYRLNPLQLRKRQPQNTGAGIVLKLGYRAPLAWQQLVGFLAGRSSARIEALSGSRYLRTVRIGANTGWVAAEPLNSAVLGVTVSDSLLKVIPQLQVRLRQLFDLDANPLAIDTHLCTHTTLKPLIRVTPGLRVPGALNGFELALRAVLGQQVSVKAARTIFGRFVETFGASVSTPFEGLDRLAPDAADVAQASEQQLIALGLTRMRAKTVRALARAVADDHLRLERGVDFSATRLALLELPGIGPWTAEYIAMRSLGDPDAFPASDLGLMQALKVTTPTAVLKHAERWQPWRAYAALHLWNRLSQGG